MESCRESSNEADINYKEIADNHEKDSLDVVSESISDMKISLSTQTDMTSLASHQEHYSHKQKAVSFQPFSHLDNLDFKRVGILNNISFFIIIFYE